MKRRDFLEFKLYQGEICDEITMNERVAINSQCRYYKASKPCKFNKLDGSECPTCRHVAPYRERILFIKLDAIGDVLRSGGLLPAIIARYEAPYVAWLTRKDSVELVDMITGVDEVIELSELGVARIAADRWDFVYSLSNDMPSATLASLASAKAGRVVGYWLEGGMIRPSNGAAEIWLEMAAFDRLKKANVESYQRRMLNILDATNNAPQPASLTIPPSLLAAAAARVQAAFPRRERQRVAVNVGAGGRWPKKMLDAQSLGSFIRILLARRDVDVMLVGGAAEADKTEQVLALCNDARVRAFLTPRSIPEFVATLAQADVLFCGDTLALHISSALGLPTVAVFGPTSEAEIADFDGLIRKLSASELECLCCYGDCNRVDHCMTQLDVDSLVSAILAQADCAMVQVRDGSANSVPIWREGLLLNQYA